MSTDLLKALVEKLDKKRYSEVIRCLARNNKRMKIPGFSSLEKTPQGLILNTAKTNKRFRDALLDACVEVILDGQVVDCTKSLLENKEMIASAQWLGVAAAYLKIGNEQDVEEICRIISEYNTESDEPIKEETKVGDKQEKREEKFREKYLKAHSEVERLSSLVDSQKVELENVLAQNNDCRQSIERLIAEKEELLRTLGDKEEEIKRLRKALTDKKESNDAGQCVNVPIKTIRIFAPNCRDILEKYTGQIAVDFENVATKTKEELAEQYDQVWVVPNVISFATSRKLSKWEKEGAGNIVWFSSIADLIARVEEMI